ncbi:MAG: hypothetical protein LBJ63_07720 [Prevotellaceae bacterium]|jgi:hypothetical protein|nr:hypothetical protein [Prevotellaceae bacterium]
MEQQKTNRTLRYEFTPEERESSAIALANKNQELRQIEDKKKSAMSDYGSMINVCKEEINKLSDNVARGYEIRDTLCTIDYHQPEMNKKLLARTDTGETWVEPMTDTDHNLFNQWEERERERLENEEEEKEEKDLFDDGNDEFNGVA